MCKRFQLEISQIFGYRLSLFLILFKLTYFKLCYCPFELAALLLSLCNELYMFQNS